MRQNRDSPIRTAGRIRDCASGPIPSPGDGELRYRVRAIGVNFADVLARMGLYPDAPKPPLVVGYEVSGHVEAMGRAVVGFAEGDRVVAMTRFGGYADTVVVPSNQAFRFPEALSDSGGRRRAGQLPHRCPRALSPRGAGTRRNRVDPERGGRRRDCGDAARALETGQSHRYGVRLQARCVTLRSGSIMRSTTAMRMWPTR